MKTINHFIKETCATRIATAEDERDYRVLMTYRKYPQLERIDTMLFKIRRDNILRVIESGADASTVISDSLREAKAKRKAFLVNNRIDENFDQIVPLCTKCNDTGFIKNKSLSIVCSCMKDELLDAYNEAGLSDYNSVMPNCFKADYIEKSAQRRDSVHKTMAKILTEITNGKSHPLYIYSDGSQTGKTFLSVVAIKTAISLGISAAYVKCDSLSDLSLDRMEDYKNIQFLVIDDYIGSVTKEKGIGGILNSILETRQNRGFATVVVSGEEPIDMVRNSDERIASKLKRATKI